MLKYTFSILLFALCLGVSGQEAPAKNKEPRSYKPYELKLGVNAIRSTKTFVDADFSSNELEAALALDRFVLVMNYGMEDRKRGDSVDYINKGSYYRVGFDRNFAKDKESGNVLSLGLRYARSSFEDQLSFTSDQGFGEQTYVFTNEDLKARWLEVVFGLRGKVVSNLYMGFSMRWQFARKINGEGDLKTYDVPGFGKTKRQNSTAFDYYLMWRIPFGDK
ncbi:hypothetical protein SAMN05421640_0300 [Ekhidna lutea]|uniref:DUF481 domain-containing protein n=1 Tax=Ekhidna lutea TaxID=447679 RepID=A0A239ERU3_EKHLU|nr:DUF6048 family protein [Ekhidna lutea]SNS47470.1 hypothetical protein SAMN05421640_0300 [Ekhidna lutea]